MSQANNNNPSTQPNRILFPPTNLTRHRESFAADPFCPDPVTTPNKNNNNDSSSHAQSESESETQAGMENTSALGGQGKKRTREQRSDTTTRASSTSPDSHHRRPAKSARFHPKTPTDGKQATTTKARPQWKNVSLLNISINTANMKSVDYSLLAGRDVLDRAADRIVDFMTDADIDGFELLRLRVNESGIGHFGPDLEADASGYGYVRANSVRVPGDLVGKGKVVVEGNVVVVGGGGGEDKVGNDGDEMEGGEEKECDPGGCHQEEEMEGADAE